MYRNKFAAYRFLINRVYQLTLTPQRQLRVLEQNTMKQISKRRGFPMNLIDLNTRIKIRYTQQSIIIQNVDSAILGVTFTYQTAL
jgi:hypothetical protein